MIKANRFASTVICVFIGFYGPLFTARLPCTATASRISDVFHLRAPTLRAGDRLKFGQCVCMDRDGRRVVFGANAQTRFKGAAYIYDLLKEPGVKMDHWGRTMLVGANTSEAETKQPGELRVIERGSAFGFSCAMDTSGAHIVIGAPGHNRQRGRVYIYRSVKKSHEWKEAVVLEGPDSRSGDSYGWALGTDEGGKTLVVSAKGRRANDGEAYVYSCEEGYVDCELSQKLTAPDYTDEAGPRGIRIRNNFGVSLALSANGDTLAVGTTGFDGEKGAVYVFQREEKDGQSQKKHIFKQRLVSLNAQKAGFFGYKVAMDSAGCSIVVGADGEDEYRGAVYTFHRRDCQDKQSDFEDEREILMESSRAEDNFGGSVTVSGDGRLLLIGAPGENTKSSQDRGVVYLYKNTGEAWDYRETIELAAEHPGSRTFFGWATGSSHSGGRIIATAPDAYGETGMAVIAGYRARNHKARSHSRWNLNIFAARTHEEL